MPVVAVDRDGAGAAMGAVNGVLVAGCGLPSIVVTLATMVILREGLRWAREGEFVRDLPAGFQWFGLPQQARAVVLVVVARSVLRGVRLGAADTWPRGGRCTPSGPTRRRRGSAGIRPRRVVFAVFVLMGVLAGLGGAAATRCGSRSSTRMPGAGLELQVIAAVVVGGAAISGGRGTLVGTLLGVLLLGTIGPALVFLHT